MFQNIDQQLNFENDPLQFTNSYKPNHDKLSVDLCSKSYEIFAKSLADTEKPTEGTYN